eukprot:gene311-429_t
MYRRIPLRLAALNSRGAVRGARWCRSGEGDKADGQGWKKKRLADMSLEELDQYEKSLTWWPYILFALFMAYVWTPEGTKFLWYLRLQMWVHEQYWKLLLPKDQADSLIREHRIGIPTANRTVQNPLAACPIPEADRRAAAAGRGTAEGAGKSDAFSASIVQVYANINDAHAPRAVDPVSSTATPASA